MVNFLDLKKTNSQYQKELKEAAFRVIDSGWYLIGNELELFEKGYADFRKDGRAFLYSAKLTEKEAQQSAISTLLNRFFGGSSQLLTQHLMEESDVDLNALQELQEKIDQKSKQPKDNS